MNKIINDLMDNKWWQEFAVVAFSFTIYTLKNDWMFISSLGSIMLGVLFYIILYVHAQFNRFIFLPILCLANASCTKIPIKGAFRFNLPVYQEL